MKQFVYYMDNSNHLFVKKNFKYPFFPSAMRASRFNSLPAGTTLPEIKLSRLGK